MTIGDKWNNPDEASSLLYSISQCYDCKHYEMKKKCKAFDIIPDKYYTNLQKHISIDDNQNGNYVYTSIG